MLTKPDPIGQIVAAAASSRKYVIAAKCDSPGYGHGSSFDGQWTWHLARQLQSRRHRRLVPARDLAVEPHVLRLLLSVCVDAG